MDSFVHLEVQSAYSFLWGTFTPEELVRDVMALGQKAVALTDYSLFGAVRFYKAALRFGIQPILGARLSIWDGSFITLLASDFTGYGNLCRLLSVVFNGDISPKNPITKQDLRKFSRGLICLAGGKDSRIRSYLEKGKLDSAATCLAELREIMDQPDRLFVVLQNHEPLANAQLSLHERSLQFMETTVEVSVGLGLPLVATNCVTFLKCEDYLFHQALVGIQQRHHHREIRPLCNDRFFLASGEEMGKRVPYPEVLANTSRIASICASFSLPLGRLHPPCLQDPTEASITLSRRCLKEVARLRKPVPVAYLKRFDQEITLIKKLQLSDFFLLVKDVVDFAVGKGIRHSVRGSAAGSLAVYFLLGGVDPVAHDLLFERFINEGRGDMPDIDLDFDSDRRDEVIQYVMSLFPSRTAMVCTIHTCKVRSAVRLAARSLGYPLDEIQRLSVCLPWSLRGHDLMDALEHLPELRDAPIQKESELISLAARLTGLPFQSSVHLGGVIIAPDDIRGWTPVGTSPKGFPVGQLDKDDVDALGLLKLDLLGLRMHTAIRKALEVMRSKGIDLELDRAALNDRKTYSLLCATQSVGVFQLESPGQRNLLGRLQPRDFSDLISEISLFRPGPVEGNMVEIFLRRRHGEEPIRHLHEDLHPILEETYGVILFQEQVLQIVHVFTGLSYAEADVFRRAMTKDRKSQKMLFLKRRFIEGALERGHSKMLAEEVFRKVASFASYGFCKAHAASFAHITYQSAYLKANHPQAFYLGLLNAGQVGSYPPSVILNEARRRGIPVYPPHVNSSGINYEAKGGGIRVPLVVINNVGSSTATRIVNERRRKGPFVDRLDFALRIPLPDRLVSSLSLAGALDGLEEREWGLMQEVCNV